MRMAGIDPIDRFWWFDWGNVQIHHDRLLPAAYQHTDEFFILAGVDFLMRDKWRHIDKIPWPGLGDVLQMIAPAHAGTAIHHINNTLQVSMVVRTRFRMGMNGDSTGPQLTGPSTSMGDGGSAGHAGCLGGVQIERTAGYHSYPVLAPVTFCLLGHDVPPYMAM